MGGDLDIGQGKNPLEFGPLTDMANIMERIANAEEFLPEICTLDCGTLNFGDDTQIVVNTPKDLRVAAKRLKEIKESVGDKSAGICSFSTTRWTVKKRAFLSILLNYTHLVVLFYEAQMDESVTEMKARLDGVYHKMLKFEFFYGLCLSIEIFGQTDELATVLQAEHLCAAEGKAAVEAIVKTLKSLNTGEKFEQFWEETVKKASDNEVDEPKLPRQKKLPARFSNFTLTPANSPSTPKEHFKAIYFKAFNGAIDCLQERFKKGNDMYERLQNLLKLVVGKSDYENELTRILDFYGEDFREEKLRSQLKIFSANFPPKEGLVFQDIIVFFKSMNPGLRSLMTEVCKVMELIQVLPATTASPERSFSRLKLIKTPTRSTMTQKRLNHFMMVALQPELADNLSTEKIADEFENLNAN